MSEILIHTQISLSEQQVEKLIASVTEEASVAEKVGGLATTALKSLADGGLMLEPIEMRALEESIGEPVDSADRIMELVEQGSGHAEGKLEVRWLVDPVYQPTMQAMADFQECTIQQIASRCMDEAVDNGWLIGEVVPSPVRVLMAPEDYKEIRDILGSEFENGTQLAGLLRQALGMTSPFAEEAVPAVIEQ